METKEVKKTKDLEDLEEYVNRCESQIAEDEELQCQMRERIRCLEGELGKLKQEYNEMQGALDSAKKAIEMWQNSHNEVFKKYMTALKKLECKTIILTKKEIEEALKYSKKNSNKNIVLQHLSSNLGGIITVVTQDDYIRGKLQNAKDITDYDRL